MLTKDGKNGYNETFWKLHVPAEHCAPGLEVGIVAGERGVTIGGGLIPWADLDEARAQLHSPPVVAEAEPVGSKVGAIEGGVVPGWRVTGRGGYSLCVQYPEWAEGCDDLKIEQLYTAPPASGAVPVPRELLDGVLAYCDQLLGELNGMYQYSGSTGEDKQHQEADYAELRALLAKGVV